MVVIRLIHAADLPDPATLLKTLSKTTDTTGLAAPRPRNDTHPGMTSGYGAEGSAALAMPLPQADPLPLSDRPPASGETINTLRDVVRTLERAGAYILAGQVRHFVHLVRLESGHIEIRPAPDAPTRLSQELGKTLSEATGMRWIVSISAAPGLPTIEEDDARAQADRDAQTRNHPLVRKVFDLFPGARIVRVHPPEDPSSPDDDSPSTKRT